VQIDLVDSCPEKAADNEDPVENIRLISEEHESPSMITEHPEVDNKEIEIIQT